MDIVKGLRALDLAIGSRSLIPIQERFGFLVTVRMTLNLVLVVTFMKVTLSAM